MTLRVECSEALLAGAGLHPVEVGDGLRWSELLNNGQTTVSQAPTASAAHRAVVFTLKPEANGFVSIGQAPDANNVALRRRLFSGVPVSFVVSEGARLMWVVG